MNAAEPFGASYAQVYDALYADKDYAAECDLIERILRANSSSPPRRVLDLGCGTGRHARLLGDRGYDVLGVDRSPYMIEEARAVSVGRPATVAYVVADLRTFRTDRRFDAVLMMFAVLGYQLEDEDVVAALRTARIHLVEGGLLLFDCWYGPAVLHQRPGDRVKTVETPAGSLRRQARSRLDVPRRRVHVEFSVDRRIDGEATKSSEDHAMRYFFRADIERFLQAAGFSLVRVGAMPVYEEEPDESTWNVLVCARAAV